MPRRTIVFSALAFVAGAAVAVPVVVDYGRHNERTDRSKRTGDSWFDTDMTDYPDQEEADDTTANALAVLNAHRGDDSQAQDCGPVGERIEFTILGRGDPEEKAA